MFVNNDQALVVGQLVGVDVNLDHHHWRAIVRRITISPNAKVFSCDIRLV
jgi:hypothetical protein